VTRTGACDSGRFPEVVPHSLIAIISESPQLGKGRKGSEKVGS